MKETEKKICSVCKEEYPATTEYFYKKKNGLYGLSSICKKCDNLRKSNNRINNKDNKTVTITLAKEEYKIAMEKAENMGMNISDYMKLSVLKNNSKYIFSIDKNLIDSEAYELSKIGTNINQIAHMCNTTGNMYPTEIEYLKNMMQQCWIIMDKIYIKINNINDVSSKI